MNAYQTLKQRFKQHNIIQEVSGFLHWDSATMMPKGGSTNRGEAMATLKKMAHELLTMPDSEELLEKSQAQDLSAIDQTNLAEMRRLILSAKSLSEDNVARLALATNTCEQAWRQARHDADYTIVRPHFESVISLTRDMANAKAEALKITPYEALLDIYEPGLKEQKVTQIFDELKTWLPDFLSGIKTSKTTKTYEMVVERQRTLMPMIMAKMGFDFDHGRLDESLHPFCGGSPRDVRLTVRYDEKDVLKAVMATLHETGHALYEQGLPTQFNHQPVGEAQGLVVHESQSLTMEMQAGRSHSALIWLADLLKEHGGINTSADDLQQSLTAVKPGFIRVDADEVTYPLHVMMRVKLEQMILSGDLPLMELPDGWNDLSKEFLGLTPKDDSEGCLQDIHWYDGGLGYFPTYTLGAIAAAQFFAAALEQVPETPDALTKGNFAPLLSWLRENVHVHGSLWSTDDLLSHATGKPLKCDAFKKHILTRYGK